MAAIVAGALLSASVELLLEKIVSGEFVDFFRSTKLDVSLLEKLKITLVSLQAVLNDAEEKQITNPAVKEWLDMLRDAVFEADDLFNEINTEALRCKVKAEYESQTSSAKVWNIFSSRFKRFNGVINSKMQILYERLERLRKQKLGLKEGVSNSVCHGTPTSSVVVDESSIYGRDNDRMKLKDFLLSKDASDGGSKIGVISIVGMGGLGKTTLAKLLYNDEEVKEKFDLKGWAYISKDFDIVRVTKTLLEAVTSKSITNDNLNYLHREYVNSKTIHNDNLNSQYLESINSKRNDTSDLNTLQVQLQQSLSHKFFLLVLDDLWDGSYVNWNNLKDIFNAGEVGSKVIITTRDERVAVAMQTFLPIYYLRPLESEYCWSLLARHAFGASNNQQQSNLEKNGREIAKKCDGLPLAAIALGGLLRIKLSQDHWNDVLKSSIWELTDVEVQPALLLSYRYLPTALKGCFAYCSIFPKNSILVKRMVVQLWIAEGLVLQPKSHKSWEKVGEEYFDELVSRSLIHRRFVDDEEASFEMHDLINDLATMVSSPYIIRFDEQELHAMVRHLSYNKRKHDSYNKFSKLSELKGLRTFLALPLHVEHVEPMWPPSRYNISDKVVCDLLPTMKQLRVLSLSNYVLISELPNSIGNLIYLQYLDLSKTMIKRLPSETCKLYNLQTLLLLGCRFLTKLPKDMGKLVNLRHLNIRGTGLTEMPLQIAKLENLQTLSDFFVSKQCDALKVTELRKFPHLQGTLSISELQNIIDPSDAFQANLKTKQQIDDLVLKWDIVSTSPPNSQNQSLVLEQLRPSTNLKNLSIEGYGGANFPNWLGDSSFGNMVSVKISNCSNCSWLPPLGQLGNLKELIICRMESVKSVGVEFYGRSSCPSFQPFPSLETLCFECMLKWEEWNLIGGTAIEFPRLRRLSLLGCPKLRGNIPDNLSTLIELKLNDCSRLVESGHSSVIKPLMLPPLNSLRKLTIEFFPHPISFPREGLPKTLQSLTINFCQHLEFLPRESLHNYTSLEYLKIEHSCNLMTSFTLGSLPVVQTLFIWGIKNLKSILITGDGSQQQSLSFLRSIIIANCDELESFSPGELGFPIPNLIHLQVFRCKKLYSLPEPMNTFPGLQELAILDLPNVQSFAKEGLPINLRQLYIGKVGEILRNSSITYWSLEHLTCLSGLVIEDDEMVKALMKIEVPLLPASLVSLRISELGDIECLDGKWLHHLASLRNLTIRRAHKLKSMPEEGLPSSLSVLELYRCPLLEASWRRKRGKEWRKVAHIPCIVINEQVIT